jgi:glycosyltransferase involved in cell wall biosynthesis
MKVALVHYWALGMRGGERVLEALCRMYPDADIVMHVADESQLSSTIVRHRIRKTFIAKLPFAKRFYQRYLPLMPLALELIDLTEYDLVISCEAGPAKGVIVRPDALHLCYIHSPMRYIWDQFFVYRRTAGRLTRWMMGPIAHYLRLWDVASAARVDRFVANSSFVASRVRKYYRRDADVVYPPVSVEAFSPCPADEVGDYYLWVGELVSYKRPDLAVEAFTRNGRRLLVVGDGAERRRLEAAAGPNVSFLGKLPFAELKTTMAACRALIFPGQEDFGIIPVEVQASGRPVIALGAGGALETVVDGETGVIFPEASVASLQQAVERFERATWDEAATARCVANAARFDEARFRRGIEAAVDAMRGELAGG